MDNPIGGLPAAHTAPMCHHQAFLAPLLAPTPGDLHLLTLRIRPRVSTVLRRLSTRVVIEDPTVITELRRAVSGHERVGVLLRTFTTATGHVRPDGRLVARKHLCGWWVHAGRFHPLERAEPVRSVCVDARTDRPLPPEQRVEYAPAWPVRPPAMLKDDPPSTG